MLTKGATLRTVEEKTFSQNLFIMHVDNAIDKRDDIIDKLFK